MHYITANVCLTKFIRLIVYFHEHELHCLHTQKSESEYKKENNVYSVFEMYCSPDQLFDTTHELKNFRSK